MRIAMTTSMREGHMGSTRQSFGRRSASDTRSGPSISDMIDAAPQSMDRARYETEMFARELRLRERQEERADLRTVLVAGAMVLLVGLMALPMIGVDLTGGSTMVAATDYDAMTPEQLANLAPAAGPADDPSLLDRLLNLFK